MNVIARGAITKTMEEVFFEDRKQIRFYSPANPHYFLDDGVLKPINLTNLVNKESDSRVSMALSSNNINSIGIRTDNNREKYVGLRPDSDQSGTEQLEFTIEKIIFDEKEQNFSLDNMRNITPILYGNDVVAIQRNRQRMRQLVKVHKPIRSFRVEFLLHLTGMTVTEINGEYWIYSEKGEFRYIIKKPYLVNPVNLEPWETEENYVDHFLLANKDGSYTYIKESTKEFYDANIIDEFYIDADVVFSSTADGQVEHRVYFVSGAWSTCRNAATGTTATSNASASNVAIRAGYELVGAWYIYIHRAFFYFDVSGYTSSIRNAYVNIYGYTNNSSGVSIQKGTQGNSLAVGDYDAFSGNLYTFIGAGSWNTGGYNQFQLNSQGITDLLAAIAAEETFKVCCRDKTKDYDNSSPSAGQTFRAGMYYADNAGTNYDPYLSLEFLKRSSIIII